MSAEERNRTFLAWLAEFDTGQLGVADDADALAWFGLIFDTYGPLGMDDLYFHYMCAQVEAVEIAVSKLLTDLHVVSDYTPTIDVDAFEAVRATVDGGMFQPAVYAHPWHQADTTTELIENVQFEMCFEDSVTWPMCLHHNLVGLRVVVKDDVAQWYCPVDERLFAPVGELVTGLGRPQDRAAYSKRLG